MQSVHLSVRERERERKSLWHLYKTVDSLLIKISTLTVDTNEPVVDLSLQAGAAGAGSSSASSTVLLDAGSSTGGRSGSSSGSSSSTVVTKTTRTVSTNQMAPFPGSTPQDFSFFVGDNTAPDGE